MWRVLDSDDTKPLRHVCCCKPRIVTALDTGLGMVRQFLEIWRKSFLTQQNVFPSVISAHPQESYVEKCKGLDFVDNALSASKADGHRAEMS
eukprot:547032-Amphidinium_carterae.1